MILPAPLVIEMFDPAVRVARDNPVPFPMRSDSCAAAEVSNPVPPFAVGSIPVTSVDPPARLIAEDVNTPDAFE